MISQTSLRHSVTITVLLALALCVSTGCGTSVKESSDTLPPHAESVDGPIRIGAIFGKSGAEAESAVADFNGARLAVDVVNRKGGILGRKLVLLEFDSRSDQAGAREAAEKAVSMGVLAVIGGEFSDNAMAIAPVLQKAGVPFLMSISTDPKLSQTGDYVFRVCFNDSFQGKIAAYFSAQELGAKTAAVLVKKDSDYSRTLADCFMRFFSQGGGTVIFEGEYSHKPGEAADKAIVWEGGKTTKAGDDFGKVLLDLKERRPDVVFIPGYEVDSGAILKQARSAGLQQVFLGGDGWSSDIIPEAGAAANGCFFVNHWHPDDETEENQRFLSEYKTKYGDKVEIIPNAPLAYDAVMILCESVLRARSFDRSKVRMALVKTRNFQGATGTITFDKGGEPREKDAYILKIVDGKVHFIKRIWEKRPLI